MISQVNGFTRQGWLAALPCATNEPVALPLDVLPRRLLGERRPILCFRLWGKALLGQFSVLGALVSPAGSVGQVGAANLAA